ncbi:ComF family protein [Streptomyces sp. NPDC093252]|uniref:ComF family protein n=1 Tax=Streptomyces sp. NPDC093252 TaxID=3154980 RepID=UPI003438C0AB
MRGWWRDLTDLVLPAECGGCGVSRAVLCGRCRTALDGGGPRRVRPVPEPSGLPVVFAAGRYADEVRAALLAHKERGALGLAGPLGAALAGAVRGVVGEGGGWGEGEGAPEPRQREPRHPHPHPTPNLDPIPHHHPYHPLLLIPLPSSRPATRARGHDPARRIAFAAAGELRRSGMAARVVPVLRQRRAVADQAGLGPAERWANLAGALTVARGADGLLLDGRIVLVDDVMTTGASLAEAARAVREALGARAVRGGTGGMTVGVGGMRNGQGRPVRKGVGEVISAAVVAAPPDSFEMK